MQIKDLRRQLNLANGNEKLASSMILASPILSSSASSIDSNRAMGNNAPFQNLAISSEQGGSIAGSGVQQPPRMFGDVNLDLKLEEWQFGQFSVAGIDYGNFLPVWGGFGWLLAAGRFFPESG